MERETRRYMRHPPGAALVLTMSLVTGCIAGVDPGPSEGSGTGGSGSGSSCNECQVGATRCSSAVASAVETCALGDDGCFHWSAPAACLGYSRCQSDACTQACTPAWLANKTTWTKDDPAYVSSWYH